MKPLALSGQRAGVRRRLLRPIAAETAGQAHQFFTVVHRFSGRIGYRVGQAILDGFEARGIGIAQISGLDRGRFVGEDAQAVVRGLAGQIHEDVDAILANLLGRLDVVEFGELTANP